MPLVVDITQNDVLDKLFEFVTAIVPNGVEVVRGLQNRVPMPLTGPGFVAMTARLLTPHRTPQDSWDQSPGGNPVEISSEQGLLFKVQFDCYGPASGDWAAMLCTVMRNDYGVELLKPTATPLYCDDPIQAPLIDSEKEYEQRWIVGANLQYNPVVRTPMQFANVAEATLINVDVTYPPSDTP